MSTKVRQDSIDAFNDRDPERTLPRDSVAVVILPTDNLAAVIMAGPPGSKTGLEGDAYQLNIAFGIAHLMATDQSFAIMAYQIGKTVRANLPKDQDDQWIDPRLMNPEGNA